MNRVRCLYEIVESSSTSITIRDVGHDRGFMSVTNEADGFVADLSLCGCLPCSVRLLYFDSDGRLDEILHDGAGKFLGFHALSQE